ncbi:cold-shock protein [Bradyrhizobium sp. sBnM-33]|jgi:cold shock CspA family protein|uniref:cold-shock protein n=1 Tax=Bradyrhizobium sp. sBnM-33 TaxID=2831780 RepID=UPI001BCE593B|nr:cold shock domain-containing protein [Bradyrhizobium sp. sBnM-33]WOH53674.1 cold shock domain-containing protein [Bradyrhizobium sp. sBnM-33]
MTTGTVKPFSPSKRYGFIRLDADGRDIFVHISRGRQAGLAGLRQGQKVYLTSTTVRVRGWQESEAEPVIKVASER